MSEGSRFQRTHRDGRLTTGPSLDTVEEVFAVYETRIEEDDLVYYGDPLVDPETVMQELWPVFREAGYEPDITTRHGEYVLVARPASVGVDGVPWTNLVLFVLTVGSTLFAGSVWYHIDPFSNPLAIWRAWPFSAAILGVLGIHEMGHYLLSRYHRVEASLPYFIPVPTLIGTMGAVITLKGQIPDRRALFDIGVAGPLAGLAATVAVTIIGLHLPPVHAPETVLQSADVVRFELGYPPLMELLAVAFDQPLYRKDPTTSVNPVVLGGWVGMFVTVLNLLPIGQLDGGHVLRAMIGSYQQVIATLVPGTLLGLAAYLYYVEGVPGNAVGVWVIWGLLGAFIAAAGPVRPIDDSRMGVGRLLVGAVTFGLGALCFVPVPIAVVG